MFNPKMNYHDYLQIDKLLSAQKPESEARGHAAHDEMLFIVVHQVYELWFKLILTELDSILTIFRGERVDERLMDLIVARLQRVIEIQKHLVDQVRIIETMTPLDFLEFRDLLIPASGFQSHQFRMLETKLGLKRDQRMRYNQSEYDQLLKPEQRESMAELDTQSTLFECVDKWLERTPFLKMQGFDFWNLYKQTVQDVLTHDLKIIQSNPALGAADRERNEKILQMSLDAFYALFDENKYNQARAAGDWRLSYKSVHAALLIQLYRDQPALQLPFRLLTALMDMDEYFTTWRQRHALMAKRMLGSKVGTGGSSGFQYLKDAADKHKVFGDLFQLTTFFVPRSKLPVLPKEVERELGFHFSK
ncbi:MAG: tryptophan 2,3-dioxygenase [Bdellovibrionales bacterium]|nr:tryptophan 2,3-dioxygenase [Bdellovibrionales bacterium]